MQKYQSHHIVEAAKIERVNVTPAPHVESEVRVVELTLEGGDVITLDHSWQARHNANPGDYFVQYEDGYQSKCPAEAFERNHALIAENGEELVTTPNTPADQADQVEAAEQGEQTPAPETAEEQPQADTTEPQPSEPEAGEAAVNEAEVPVDNGGGELASDEGERNQPTNPGEAIAEEAGEPKEQANG